MNYRVLMPALFSTRQCMFFIQTWSY